MRKSLLNFLASMALSLGLLSTVAAQEVIKIGQIEAQTGPSSSLGFMATQGVKLAVHQINQAGGLSILLAEQNASFALRMADRAYVIESGSVVLNGTAQDLLDEPRVRQNYIGY